MEGRDGVLDSSGLRFAASLGMLDDVFCFGLAVALFLLSGSSTDDGLELERHG